MKKYIRLSLFLISCFILAGLPLRAQTLPEKLTPNLPENCSPPALTYPAAPAAGSTNPVNHVRTYTAQSPITSETNISNPAMAVSEVHTATEYLDGLGRPLQTVLKQQSPQVQDIIQPAAYDAYGRQPKNYLPYTRAGNSDGTYRPHALQEQYSYYKDLNFYNLNQPRTAYPYAETEFEASPRSRVLRQGMPGENWRLDSNHELKYEEQANTTTDAVRQWQVGTGLSTTLTSPGVYAAGQLYASTVTDENGGKTISFADKQGRVVLEKAEQATGQYLSTYYAYDNQGNLRYVLPPKAVEIMSQNSWALTTAANVLVFRYHYDERRRLIIKQTPGAQPVYLVYNKRNQTVMTQDGVQRATSKWSFAKYDALNRPIFTGILTDARTHAQLQTDAQNSPAPLFETRTSTTTGYTLTSAFPTNVTEADVLTVTYYDDYQHPALAGVAFVPEAGYTAASPNQRVTGQVTGQRTKALDISYGYWLRTVTFYDDKYRPIQTVSNSLLESTDRLTTRYSFVGRPTQTLQTHTKGTTTHVVQTTREYDHAGRLFRTLQKLGNDPATINAQPEVVVNRLKYNELGQVIDKRLHSTDGTNFLQSVDYRYNVRGWLTSINNSALSNDNDATNNDQNDLFGQELSYDCGFNQKYYNGNIAGVKWQSAGDNVRRAYGYHYDKLNRVLQADFRALNPASQTWTAGQLDATNGHYDTWNLRYDGNGNLQSMHRNGLVSATGAPQTYGLLDKISYKYEPAQGNQLLGADDTQTTAQAHDFEDLNGRKYSTAAPEYSYDDNGNLKKDDNKGIVNVNYNHLNLPSKVDLGGGREVYYFYSATGQKLRKRANIPLVAAIETDYVGDLVYEQGALKFRHMPEGRLVYQAASNTWRYEYHLKDHLGSLRVAFADASTSFMATMEESRATEEDSVFTNVQTTRQQDRLRARTGNYAARLNAQEGRLLGPGKRLSVHKGDSVSVQVFGHYPLRTKPSLAYSLGAWLLSNAVVQVQEPPREGSSGSRKPAFPFISAGLALTPQVIQQEKDLPTAYVKYIAYDTAGNYLSSSYQLLSQQAQENWQSLQLTYQPEQDGYVDVYVANESGEEVFFDDMTISNATAQIVQENHYDVWGQNLVGIEQAGNPNHRYQYTGKEKQDDYFPSNSNGIRDNGERAMDWIDYGARFYDPQLGRWHVPDPLANATFGFSPYHYVLNNPVSYTDPTGLLALQEIVDKLSSYSHGGTWYNTGGDGTFSEFSSEEAAFDWGIVNMAQYSSGGGAGGHLLSTVSITPGNEASIRAASASAAAEVAAHQLGLNQPIEVFPNMGADREPYEGFWGKLNYYWNGGQENGNRYDIEGNYLGPGYITGAPDFVGGMFGGAGAVAKTGEQLYEIADGVRRAKAAQQLGRTSIEAMDNAGNVFQVPIKNLRSPFKSSIDVSNPMNRLRYDRIYDGFNAGDNLPPIYVNPGSRGVSIFDVILKP